MPDLTLVHTGYVHALHSSVHTHTLSAHARSRSRLLVHLCYLDHDKFSVFLTSLTGSGLRTSSSGSHSRSSFRCAVCTFSLDHHYALSFAFVHTHAFITGPAWFFFSFSHIAPRLDPADRCLDRFRCTLCTSADRFTHRSWIAVSLPLTRVRGYLGSHMLTWFCVYRLTFWDHLSHYSSFIARTPHVSSLHVFFRFLSGYGSLGSFSLSRISRFCVYIVRLFLHSLTRILLDGYSQSLVFAFHGRFRPLSFALS